MQFSCTTEHQSLVDKELTKTNSFVPAKSCIRRLSDIQFAAQGKRYFVIPDPNLPKANDSNKLQIQLMQNAFVFSRLAYRCFNSDQA